MRGRASRCRTLLDLRGAQFSLLERLRRPGLPALGPRRRGGRRCRGSPHRRGLPFEKARAQRFEAQRHMFLGPRFGPAIQR